MMNLVHTAMDIPGADAVAAGCFSITSDFTPTAEGTRSARFI